MQIEEAEYYITELKNNSITKYEKLIYDKFISILSNLKERDLTENQLKLIHKELEALCLNIKAENKKKYLGKELEKFKKFLKDNLALISEGHYTVYGMSFGMMLGVLAQLYFGVYSMLVGMFIGFLIGVLLDAEAKKQGRVIETKTSKK